MKYKKNSSRKGAKERRGHTKAQRHKDLRRKTEPAQQYKRRGKNRKRKEE